MCDRLSCLKCGKVNEEIFELMERYNERNLKFNCDDCTAKLPKIKELLTLTDDVSMLINRVDSIEEKIKSINKSIEDTQTNQNKIKESIRKELTVLLLDEIESHKKETNNTAWNTAPPQPTPNLNAIISEEMREQQEREKIKTNLIIFGIREEKNEKTDLEAAKKLISAELGIEADLVGTSRCGRENHNTGPEMKPRPLKLFMRDLEGKRSLLRRAKELRQSQDEYVRKNIYINPDLTSKQQLEAKKLRESLRKQRMDHPDKNFRISKGIIVETQTERS